MPRSKFTDLLAGRGLAGLMIGIGILGYFKEDNSIQTLTLGLAGYLGVVICTIGLFIMV